MTVGELRAELGRFEQDAIIYVERYQHDYCQTYKAEELEGVTENEVEPNGSIVQSFDNSSEEAQVKVIIL